MQANTKVLVESYIRVHETLHISEIIKLYNEGNQKEAKLKEDTTRKVYAQLQQIMNSLDGKRRYRDRNYIKNTRGEIIGFRLCEFDDVQHVFNNEASKEVNQYGYEPPLNGTKNEYATFRGRVPTYKHKTDYFLGDLDL